MVGRYVSSYSSQKRKMIYALTHTSYLYEHDRLIHTLNTQPYFYIPSECASQYSGMIMCNPDTLGTEDTALISEVS